MNDKKLVLGATGGIGRAVVKALVESGHNVRVLVRSSEKAEKYLMEFKNVEIVEGDASKPDPVKNALEDCTHLFYCLNVPYQNWEDAVKSLLKTSIDACVEMNVKLVFPGNVYNYGLAQYNPVDEKHPHNAHTKKGKIRIEM